MATEIEKELDRLTALALTLAKGIKQARASLRQPKPKPQRLAKTTSGGVAFPPSRRPSRVGTRWLDAVYLALRRTPDTPLLFADLCERARDVRQGSGLTTTANYTECVRSVLRQHPELFADGTDGWLLLDVSHD